MHCGISISIFLKTCVYKDNRLLIFCTFPALILKYTFHMRSLYLMRAKEFLSLFNAKFTESLKITYTPPPPLPKYVQHFNVANWKLIFYKVPISTNYEKIIIKYVILSVPLASIRYHFAHCKENNAYEKVKNRIIFQWNREWAKVNLINSSWNPYCVVSFNMGWQYISILSRAVARYTFH